MDNRLYELLRRYKARNPKCILEIINKCNFLIKNIATY